MQRHSCSDWGLWERFGITHPAELKIVISHMPEGGAACLRQVSRGMRRAVNSTVEAVQCGLAAQLPHTDLAGTFPDADWLLVDLSDSAASAEVSTFMDLLWASSPTLMHKISALEICGLARELRPDSIAACTADFLARCASSRTAGRVQACRFCGWLHRSTVCVHLAARHLSVPLCSRHAGVLLLCMAAAAGLLCCSPARGLPF
jgi:hypothetical protein